MGMTVREAVLVFIERMKAERRHDEYKVRYKFHRDFGETTYKAQLMAATDLGFVSAEREEQILKNREAKEGRRKKIKHLTEGEKEQAVRDLLERSEGTKFDAVAGIEWVAANFHHEFVTPDECPHIIAWNVLQTSKKYEVAFFKDFLTKALTRGITDENTEEFKEDEMQIGELRASVAEILK